MVIIENELVQDRRHKVGCTKSKSIPSYREQGRSYRSQDVTIVGKFRSSSRH